MTVVAQRAGDRRIVHLAVLARERHLPRVVGCIENPRTNILPLLVVDGIASRDVVDPAV
jgi:hypothetical protein